MNCKLFLIVSCFLVISSFVYSSSVVNSLYHSRTNSSSSFNDEIFSDSKPKTIAQTGNSHDSVSQNNNDDDSAQHTSIEQSFLPKDLQKNSNHQIIVLPAAVATQRNAENELSETSIQALQETIQELQEKLKTKEFVVVQQGQIIQTQEEQISKMTESHQTTISKIVKNHDKMISEKAENYRRNMIAVAAVSAVSTVVLQKIVSGFHWFGLSTKGSSESK